MRLLSTETPSDTGKLVNSMPEDRKNLAILACVFNGDGVPSTMNTGSAPNCKNHHIVIKLQVHPLFDHSISKLI